MVFFAVERSGRTRGAARQPRARADLVLAGACPGHCGVLGGEADGRFGLADGRQRLCWIPGDLLALVVLGRRMVLGATIPVARAARIGGAARISIGEMPTRADRAHVRRILP